MTFHPWRWLRAKPEIEVIWQPQPVGRIAATDGHRVILMDPRQSQAQRRCAITHEQIHIEHRHVGGCSPTEERQVRAATARRLIALDELVAAYRWSRDLREMADELWVTPDVVRERLAGLAAEERRRLASVHDDLELTC
ncbi:ImmA/IrrE family metallo-endopeptidase [Cellulomonas hominis]|uniref:ImmA/IrrE family metallo-endopeptidase n=1 Tax=Cellulomonas hominis TaxID=156981 RepID=A0A7Z8NT19_9CELL|nr:ImmA/IrrE family metallo-endopeptidase [Cellulomonas hominis]TKR27167.1 ImmA/IrrE family metallo-endopeptidase [Cellulomonas hominis]